MYWGANPLIRSRSVYEIDSGLKQGVHLQFLTRGKFQLTPRFFLKEGDDGIIKCVYLEGRSFVGRHCLDRSCRGRVTGIEPVTRYNGKHKTDPTIRCDVFALWQVPPPPKNVRIEPFTEGLRPVITELQPFTTSTP